VSSTARPAAGASFHEVVLIDSMDNVLRRFADRARSSDPDDIEGHRNAGHHGGAAELSLLYDRLLAYAAARRAPLMVTRTGEIGAAYQDLLASLR
jgi:hypothetical protein